MRALLAMMLCAAVFAAGCLGQSNPSGDQAVTPTSDNGAGGSGNTTRGNVTASGNATAGASASSTGTSAPVTVSDKSYQWLVNAPGDDKFSVSKPFTKLHINVTQDANPGAGTGDISIKDAAKKEVAKASISFGPTGGANAAGDGGAGISGDYTITFGNTGVGTAKVTITVS